MLFRNKKKNDYHEGKWNGLGGKFEAGESPEQCAIREVHEESGLTMIKPEMAGFLTFPMFDGKDDWYVFVFRCSEFEGDITDSPEGELAWIPTGKLFELNLWKGDQKFIKWMLDKKFFSARFVYNGEELETYTVEFH
jgi:8-oxo-dGTP diphosphatase